EYRGNLFFCEWGRAVMRYRTKPAGSSFAPLKEITFAAGAANDPYGFRPTDLVVGQDGALFVSDWADGQRPKRGRGRIYRITYLGAKQQRERMARLDSESYYERVAAQETLESTGRKKMSSVRETQNKLAILGRMHVVWALVRCGGSKVVDEL